MRVGIFWVDSNKIPLIVENNYGVLNYSLLFYIETSPRDGKLAFARGIRFPRRGIPAPGRAFETHLVTESFKRFEITETGSVVLDVFGRLREGRPSIRETRATNDAKELCTRTRWAHIIDDRTKIFLNRFFALFAFRNDVKRMPSTSLYIIYPIVRRCATIREPVDNFASTNAGGGGILP